MSLVDRVPVNESNRETRQALALLVDVSESMRNDLPAVQEGLTRLREALTTDTVARNCVEIAFLTFGGVVKQHGDFAEVSGFEVPQLVPVGNTPMAVALDEALNLVEAKKAAYKAAGLQYHRPWIYLITDGEPTDQGDLWPRAVERIQRAEREQKVALYAVGTETANFARLGELCVGERRPLKLKGHNWSGMFEWLKATLVAQSRTKSGEKAKFPSPGGWGESP
jgi:uncharacterized protein YegL